MVRLSGFPFPSSSRPGSYFETPNVPGEKRGRKKLSENDLLLSRYVLSLSGPLQVVDDQVCLSI